MAKKYKLELTESQFLAMIDLADTIEGMIGEGGDFSKEASRNLLFFDRMLETNGYKRGK
tara:strand:- start:1472 stop:1648 length:177 start_codon:yes stop_codon:yes gene_type:complete